MIKHYLSTITMVQDSYNSKNLKHVFAISSEMCSVSATDCDIIDISKH